MSSKYSTSTSTVQVQYKYSTSTVQVQYTTSTSTVQVLSLYNASRVQVQYNYTTSTLQVHYNQLEKYICSWFCKLFIQTRRIAATAYSERKQGSRNEDMDDEIKTKGDQSIVYHL